PAIFKALVERLEPFCFLNPIYAISKAADPPDLPKQRVLELKPPACHIYASAEMLGLFYVCCFYEVMWDN
ncbi:hypothetical protein, partial [Vibrio coralliirubri]|uniref:hypothetical protein n=1 Tax=Vibrio coralliirubri TaxID=1516159 RepID=UPI00065DE1DB